MIKPGERVVMVVDRTNESMVILGHGTAIGLVEPPPDVYLWGVQLVKLGVRWPGITLDSGQTALTCEAVVVPEEQYSRDRGQRIERILDIVERRKTYSRLPEEDQERPAAIMALTVLANEKYGIGPVFVLDRVEGGVQ